MMISACGKKQTTNARKPVRLVKGALGPAECGRRRGGFGRGQEQENRGKRPGQEQKARNSENGKSLANLILIQHAAARRGGGSLRAFRRAVSIGLWVVGLSFLSLLSFLFFMSLLAWLLSWVVFWLFGCWVAGLNNPTTPKNNHPTTQ